MKLVIKGTTSGYKDMADGTLRLIIDIEPNDARNAVQLFADRGTLVAIAALDEDQIEKM
jgi:hypothetical protein